MKHNYLKLTLCTVLFAVMCLSFCGASAEDGLYTDFYYQNPAYPNIKMVGDFAISGDVLVQYLGYESEIEIPRDWGITTIADGAFAHNYTLQSIVLPSTCTVVGEGAFANCSSLNNVYLPAGLTKIGNRAFYGTAITSVCIPYTITNLGSAAFMYCYNLDMVSIPAQLTYIPEDTFSYCSNLRNINIPEGVVEVGCRAFYDTDLESVTLPSTLTTIGDSAFSFTDIKSLIIPDSVTSIGYAAFEYCEDLETVVLPLGITRIPDNMFFWCGSLNNVVIPAQTTEICGSAFSGCRALTNITFMGNAVESIGDYAFETTALTSIELPDGVKSIGYSAFSGCNSLESIVLPATIESIGMRVVRFCNNLKTIYYKGSEAQWQATGCTDEDILPLIRYNCIDVFADVHFTDWYHEGVFKAASYGLMNGKGQNCFYPNDFLTYAEAIKLACTINQLYMGGEALSNGSELWYSTYLDYAYQNGITDTDMYDVAKQSIDRQNFVKIFAKAIPESLLAPINDIADGKIPDVAQDSDFAPFIYTFYRAGILTGSNANGDFNPSGNIKRSEAATIMVRIVEAGSRKTVELN